MTGPQRAFVAWVGVGALVLLALFVLAATAEPDHVEGRSSTLDSPL